MTIRVKDLVGAVGGDYKGSSDSSEIKNVSIDTRTIKEGDIFFAIKGENFDGNDYIEEAFNDGALVCVGESYSGTNKEFIKVSDSVKALGDLANYKRKKFNTKIIAVTGSVGKTSTKEMIALVLRENKKVLKTEGNLNNLIGLPLTLLKLDETIEVAVVEFGISVEGEMDRLSKIAEPNTALITNIGIGHLEGLDCLSKVAEEKGVLYSAMAVDGTLVVNLDDENVVSQAEKAKCENIITFGKDEKANVQLVNTNISNDGKSVKAEYDINGEKLEVTFNNPFLCNGINGAAAIAVGLSEGVKLEDMKKALENFKSIKGRMETTEVDGVTIINDTYNSNPQSMNEALKTLESIDGKGRQKILVVGDMLELGYIAKQQHIKIGAIASTVADVVVAVGDYADFIKEGLVNWKFDKENIYIFKNSSDASKKINHIVTENSIVLVKGSRGVKMENIVQALEEGK